MRSLRLTPKGIPVAKRTLDVIIASIVSILLTPIMLIISLVVGFAHGFPILFQQKRPGYKGEVFTIYKFRTMKNIKDKEGKLLPDEKRMTKFGRFLRSTSLDELPELFNVLKGEMSLVGPRPLLEEYLPRYNVDQFRRHEVLPGITGWAQIHGRNAINWQEKFELDLWYVDHWSLWLDIKIILLSLSKVIRREGITQPGQTTAELFMGNPPVVDEPLPKDNRD